MPDITVEDVLKVSKEAMEAGTELKQRLEKQEKKTDGLDLEAIGKMQKSILDAAELSQDLEQKLAANEQVRKAAEEKHAQEVKELTEKLGAGDVRIQALELAFERSTLGGGDGDEEKANADKWKKAFNEFARSGKGEKKQFATFVEGSDEYKDLAVNSNTDGGYLVRPQYGPMIEGRIFETTPMRLVASQMNIGTDRLILPVDDDEVTFGWVGETDDRSDTNSPTLKEIEIVLQEIFAQPKATKRMLDDGEIDMEAWLIKKITQKFSRAENTGFVSGTGIKSPKGFMSYADLDTPGTYQFGRIEQVKSGIDGGFNYDSYANVQNSLKEDFQPNAVWMGQRATYGAAMLIKDGDQRPIFNQTFDKNTGLALLILGQRWLFAADMPAKGTTGGLPVAYGDFGEGYMIIDKPGISILLDPYTKKGWIKFYTTKRVGGGVTNFEAIKLMKQSA